MCFSAKHRKKIKIPKIGKHHSYSRRTGKGLWKKSPSFRLAKIFNESGRDYCRFTDDYLDILEVGDSRI